MSIHNYIRTRTYIIVYKCNLYTCKCKCVCVYVCVYISQKGNRLLGLIGGTGWNYLAQLSKKLRYLRVLHFPSSSIFALIRPLLYISFLLLLSLLKRTHEHSQTGTHHYRTVATYKHNHETRFVKNLEQIGMFRSFLDVRRGTRVKKRESKLGNRSNRIRISILRQSSLQRGE